MPVKPPTVVTAEWTGELAFTIRAGDHAIVTDGDSAQGLSPVQLLGAALAGCMATDVALILTRGRQPLKNLVVTLSARRADHDPHRVRRRPAAFRRGRRRQPGAARPRRATLARKILFGLALDA